MTNFAAWVTRFGVRLAQLVSPGLAARAAFYLFTRTPSAKPLSQKARVIHEAGRQKLSGAEQIALPLGRGDRAFARCLNGGAFEKRPHYLVVHGWGSAGEYMADIATALAATGAEVVVLDFPGHGLSGGRRLHMGLAVKAIAAAFNRFGRFDAAIGHSFGGAALICSAIGAVKGVAPLVPGRIAIIASPSEMGYLMTDLGKALGLKRRAQDAFEALMARVLGQRVDGFDVVSAAAKLQLPLLVVHAEDDKEVSPDHARRYASIGDRVSLFWANGYGHRRIVFAPPVIEKIESFLDSVKPQHEDHAASRLPVSSRRASS